MAWQQVSVGKHHAGARFDVHVGTDLLQFWVGNELIKTVPRTATGRCARKTRHGSNLQTGVSRITRMTIVKHHPKVHSPTHSPTRENITS